MRSKGHVVEGADELAAPTVEITVRESTDKTAVTKSKKIFMASPGSYFTSLRIFLELDLSGLLPSAQKKKKGMTVKTVRERALSLFLSETGRTSKAKVMIGVLLLVKHIHFLSSMAAGAWIFSTPNNLKIIKLNRIFKYKRKCT